MSETCDGCGLTRAVHDPDESWYLHQASCLRVAALVPPKEEPEPPPRHGVVSGLGYTLLAYSMCLYSIVHYALWTLPRCAWLRWTGQIPPPRDPTPLADA